MLRGRIIDERENNLERENKKCEGASRENNKIKVSFSSNKLIIFLMRAKTIQVRRGKGQDLKTLKNVY